MKKLFLAMMALVVLLASCSKEETPGQINGEESLVTFTLSTDQLATKAVGDGKTADQLYFAVYDAAGNIVSQISKTTVPETMSNLGANVELALLNGETYSIIFWAQSEDAPCTMDWTAKTMTYDPLTANQEGYDAFFAYVAPFKVAGNKSETVKLTRPFAQLNIATTEGDLAELMSYYNCGEFTQAKVSVSKLPNMLNLVTGEATGEVDVTYDFAEISLLNDETFPITGYTEYIAMNYVLVSTGGTTVDVTLDINTTAEDKLVTREFANVPVKRNYRTNIYGDLYASTFEYNVQVTPGFGTPEYNIFSGVVNLTQNIETNKTFVVAADDEAIIDLGNYDFVNNSGSSELEEGDGIIAYGKLSIKGNGTVEAYTRTIWARGGTGAEVNIYGGNFVGSQDGASSVIYASGNGVVNIYGGVFEATVADKTSYANKNGVYAALNMKDDCTGGINVYGGTFINFDPANPGTELASWMATHPNGFVADGYVSVKVAENTYQVVKAVKVSSVAELTAAIENGGEVALAEDMNVDAAIVADKDMVLHLNGKKLTTTKAVYQSGIATALINVQGGANVTISGEGEIDAFQYDDYAVEVRGGTVTILSGKFVGSGQAVNVIEGTANIQGGYFEDKSTYAGQYLINCTDASYREGKAIVNVTGGTFKGFNPDDNAAEGANTDFVPDGYVSTEISTGVWAVTKQ